MKIQAEIVNGKCPTCTEITMLVGLTPELFRCMNCGSDLQQHVNGKITYLPVMTSRELFEADLLKKSEQLPTDQEQYMLLEALFSDVEKLQKNQEQNMTNKVNIEFTQKQLEKLLTDVEKLKDKVRQNGSYNE